VLLGGRVAEEMVFGDVSTGAQNDLQKATEIARTMVTQFGMSERLGLVALEGPRSPLFLPVPNGHAGREYSEETARIVDEEIKKLLAEAHAKVRESLAAHRPVLEELARLLLNKEVVERPELLALLKVRSIDVAKEKDQAPADGELKEEQKG
jgi:cell division protease FtsH